MNGATARRGVLAACLLLVLLGAATVASSVFVARKVENDRRAELRRGSEATREAIARRLLANVEVLYGIRGVFESPRPVSRQEFRQYVRSLAVPARYPGIQALSFAETVEGFEESSYERAVRADARRSGSPYPRGFRIRPPGRRQRFMAVSYLEPVEGNEPAFGLDLLSEPRRTEAVERAQRTGRPAATAPIRLVQETGAQRGFLILMPARNVAGALSNPGTGRFEGVVSGAIRMGDLIENVIGERPEFEVEVYDLGVAGARRLARPAAANLTYDGDGSPAAPGGFPTDEAILSTLDVAGRTWAVYYEPFRGQPAAATAAPYLVAAGGLALSILAAAMLLSLSRRRERAERDLAERDAQRLKDEFFALVSHELRTPLTSIVGYAAVLAEDEALSLSSEGREFLEVIARNAARLDRLLDDLLLVAQVDAGTFSIHWAVADLPAIARSSVEAARPQATSGGVELELAAEPVRSFAGDPERIGQVLDNLISNALKFTPRGGRVVVALREQGGCAVLEVSDTGAGIPAAEQEKLFDRFYRAASTGGRGARGVGLGLPIVRAIVEAHGGRIAVDSRPSAGATFTVELPIRAPVATDPELAAPRAGAPG